MLKDDEVASFEIFADCLSTTVIAKLAPNAGKGPRKRVKGRKNEIKPVIQKTSSEDDLDNAAELGDFVQVCFSSNFPRYRIRLNSCVVLGR